MAAALSIAYTATPLAAGVKLAVFATRPLSAGISFQPKGAYKLITVSAAAAASPLNVLAAYNARFGTFAAGQKILFKLIPIGANGIAGQVIDTSIVAS